jgi:hypothetical protein
MTDEGRRDALPDLTGLRDAVALALRGSDPVRHRPTLTRSLIAYDH